MKDKLFNKYILLFLLIILSIYSVSIGVKNFSLINLFQGQKDEIELVLLSRIPRLVSIIVVGASLSIAGVIMQVISNNKFVSPTTIGIMDWAKFGIMIALIFFGDNSTFFKMLIAFAFTLFGTLFFMKILNQIKARNNIIIPLIGIMLGNVINSITGFVSFKYDLIQNINSWLQGSFSLITKGRYELLYIGIPFLILAYLYTDKFMIVGMGEGFSKNLGLEYEKVVLIGLVIVSMITSTVVVVVGSIPFIGLIVPNIISVYRGDNMKKSLLETALLGSLFVLVCDIFGRVVIFPYEVPISVVISVVGSVIFLILLFRRYKNAN